MTAHRYRVFLIGPTVAKAREFYAPGLLAAFHLARVTDFGSATLTCYGSFER